MAPDSRGRPAPRIRLFAVCDEPDTLTPGANFSFAITLADRSFALGELVRTGYEIRLDRPPRIRCARRQAFCNDCFGTVNTSAARKQTRTHVHDERQRLVTVSWCLSDQQRKFRRMLQKFAKNRQAPSDFCAFG